MPKNFILDTNVLLHDPRSIYGFKDNNVIIPIYVIEEIDQFKRDLSELGRNARLVTRYLDSFRAEGSLQRGGAPAARRLPPGGLRRAGAARAAGGRQPDGQPHPRGGHRV